MSSLVQCTIGSARPTSPQAHAMVLCTRIQLVQKLQQTDTTKVAHQTLQ